MADTIPNIPLPAGTPVDLYAASGVTQGVKINVQNLGRDEIRLTTKATAPDPADGFLLLSRGSQASNEVGDSGAWAVSLRVDGSVNVRIS